ncbi:MAG: Signal recognition particle core component [Thelocarpon superellum]|nr:MAG: Signal recognition particle core component [Thelocarpon superellum]
MGAADTASQALAAQLRRTTLDDPEEVLKAANAVLKKSKNHAEAQTAKLRALLKLERYEDALQVLEEGGEALKTQTPLESAYALYKVGRYEEAEELSRSHSADHGRGMQHVEAQVAYRLEDFARAADIYAGLVAHGAEGQHEESELRINHSATVAQLEWAGQGSAAPKQGASREDLEAFETVYNVACRHIARGELTQAAFLLKRARDLCNASEELAEDEKAAELLPIAVQLAYTLTRLGKHDEADQVRAGISIGEIADLSTRQIAQNNDIISTTHAKNPFLAHRHFHSSPPLPQTAWPFAYQSRLLRQNGYVLDLSCLKYSGVAASTAKYIAAHAAPTASSAVNRIAVVNAAAHARSQDGKAALKAILPELAKRPADVGLLLTAIQLYMVHNNYGSAIALLEAFFKRLETSSTPADQDVRFAPGLVAVLVSLYRVQGRRSHITSELAKAASYWQHKSKEKANAHASPSLLLAAGIALLESSETEDHQAAAEIFDDLRQQEAGHRGAIAGYVAANATTSPDLVASEVGKLTPVARLTAGVDVAALLDAGIPSMSSVSTTGSKKRAAADEQQRGKKRVRKSRLPKHYDPQKAPDPERWLPLRDRSTYRPKGKKGKMRAAALTQGGVSATGSEERLPLVGGAGAVKVEKASGGGGGGGGGGSSKSSKKKKGGKR